MTIRMSNQPVRAPAQLDRPAELPADRWHKGLRPTAAKAALRMGQAPQPPVSERPRTVSEAADELGLSVHTIRAWIARRRLAHLRLGRAIRVPAAELRRVIEQSTVPAERK
jgi:excisionase family DNA binding protein